MVARLKPARYGLSSIICRGRRGGLPKKQLAAAHFGSKIRPNIKVLAGNAVSAEKHGLSSCEGDIMSEIVTAGILVIGDEILSGRTKDKNIGHIAEFLTNIGIDLSEVRVVPDIEAEIVAALDALRHRYTYVFTTGGIGPTHDDITADAVAKAFGVPIDHDPRAVAMMRERFPNADLNE